MKPENYSLNRVPSESDEEESSLAKTENKSQVLSAGKISQEEYSIMQTLDADQKKANTKTKALEVFARERKLVKGELPQIEVYLSFPQYCDSKQTAVIISEKRLVRVLISPN